MEQQKTINTMDATKQVLRRWTPGTYKLGYEITEEVRAITWEANRKRPMDATVLRYVRYLKDIWHIVVPNRGESKYYKEMQEE